MSNVVQLIERTTNLTDLMVKDDNPDISQYRLLVSRTLDGIYDIPGTGTNGVTGTVAAHTIVASVNRGATQRSTGLMRRGLGFLHGSTRGQTRMLLDIEDSIGDSAAVPRTDEMAFFRIQTFSIAANAFLEAGPITIAPPAGFLSSSAPMLEISGTAPSCVTATISVGGFMSANALHLRVPNKSAAIRLKNLDDTNNLKMSTGAGHMAIVLEANEEFWLAGAFKDLFLEGVTAADGTTGIAVQYSAMITIAGSNDS